MPAVDGPVNGGLECTEDEPDDDFCPPPAGGAKVPQAPIAPTSGDSAVKSSQGGEEKEDSTAELKLEDSPPPPATLDAHWHQLEGVPRPPGIGPRYLAWSGHGHIAMFPEQGRLEVKYAAHEGKQEQIRDSIGFNMAAISGGACCLAAGEGAEGGSQLTIRPAERWEKAVFQASLGSAGEAVEAVACGETFAAALTSRRLLRVYGLSGLPIGVISTPGRSVALAARGQHLLVAIGASGSNQPKDGEDDALEYWLLDVHSKAQRSAGRLPLSPGSRLRWLGFSAELVPLTIDTLGVVRALFGTGPGSWGPASGNAGEWTVVLQLAEEEAKVGPLWTIDAKNGALFCAEVGTDAIEPQPAEIADAIGLALPESSAKSDTKRFGHGACLRELKWQLPLGPFFSCGAVAETVLRESLLSRHMEEMVAIGAFSTPEEQARATLSATGGKSAALKLYAELVKGDEVERALDVARHFVAGAGASKMLSFAQQFAEKAGKHKLADQISTLSRVVVASATSGSPFGATAAKLQTATVPKVVQREAAPLFEPGEGEEENGPRTPASSRLAASPAMSLMTPPSSIVEESKPEESREAPTQVAAIASVATDAPPLEPAVPAQAPVISNNPFARKAKPLKGNERAPHLLRDALGGGARRPAPPVDSSSVEPAAKAARLSS
mmetsp:Transcript_118837/g.296350  ORF Transcript_118837/g.296350 Transcript_118837/m.296350 type:complete len:667 (+) Transcript_118837:62-2062(+)